MPFISYSQNLEDVLLYKVLKNIPKGFYVDVGACDPVIDSVTKAFYDMGWRGINIEPTSEYFQKITKQRPEDTNFNCAINDKPGILELHVIAHTGLSTGIEHIALLHERQRVKVEIPAFTLRALLAPYKHQDIHFLKVDVEGMEYEALNGMDFKECRPWIVLVESLEPQTFVPNHQKWDAILLNSNYDFVYFDGLNRYYLANEHNELAGRFSPPDIFDDYIIYKEVQARNTIRDEYESRLAALAGNVASLEQQAAQDRELSAKNQKIAEDTRNCVEILAKEYEATRVQLASARNHAEALAKDHERTKAELAETRELLHVAKTEKVTLREAIIAAQCRTNEFAAEASYAQRIEILQKQLLDLRSHEIASLKNEFAQATVQARALESRIQAEEQQHQAEGARLHHEIQRLKRLLYSATTGTHFYRAFRVLMRDPHYRQPAPKPAQKRDENPHASCLKHLHRATCALVTSGMKPWHTHLYRAWRSLVRDPKYIKVRKNVLYDAQSNNLVARQTAFVEPPPSKASETEDKQRLYIRYFNEARDQSGR